VISFSVTLPYSEVDFDAAMRDKFKAAVAATAGTRADNVEIASVKNLRRADRLEVKTKVSARFCCTDTAISLGGGSCLLLR
jgi:hypothetical protein